MSGHVICKLEHYMTFIYFSCIVDLAGTSDAILSTTGKTGYYCLIPHLKTKNSSFYPLNTVIAVCL